MFLIVGLGNPEKKYLKTFHNTGFRVADLLAQKFDVTFDKSECRAVTAHARMNGEKIIIAKPLTYMNLSGESVAELTRKYKIETGNLAVVYDDTDLPLGSVRIRKEGSAGTHNGMRNIVELLRTENFPRVRIGIGSDDTPMALIDYVLSTVSDKDAEIYEPTLKEGAEALYDFACGKDIEEVMRKYNKRK